MTCAFTDIVSVEKKVRKPVFIQAWSERAYKSTKVLRRKTDSYQ